MSTMSRLRPSINQAMVVTMAVIWEEAIDGGTGLANLHAILGHVFNSLLVTVLCVAIKCATHELPKTRLLELIVTTLQTLTGWMWKAVVNELIDLAHEPVAAGHPAGGVSDGTMWGCSAITLIAALVVTLVGVATLRFLPLLAAPKAPGCKCGLVSFHIVGTLCGAVTLPIAFSWHYVIFNVSTSIVSPRFAGASPPPPAVRWLVFAAVLTLAAILVIALVGKLRETLKPWLATAAQSKRIPEGRIKRYEASTLKTLDFLAAWMIFAVLQSSHTPIDCSACFPVDTPHAVETAGPGLAVVLAFVVLVLVFACVVLKAALGTKADASAKTLAAEAPACTRWRGNAWTIVLGTLGILLGWAVKDAYDASLHAVIVAVDGAEHAKTVAHFGALFALIFSLVLLACVACANGQCAKPLAPTTTVTPQPPPKAEEPKAADPKANALAV